MPPIAGTDPVYPTPAVYDPASALEGDPAQAAVSGVELRTHMATEILGHLVQGNGSMADPPAADVAARATELTDALITELNS